MRILIILGHPRRDSLCGAMADAYREGAEQAGMEPRLLALGELDFDPDVRVDSPENQPLEPDLQRAQQWLDWAEHVVFVYPTWWGTMPARLKGFLDRLVMPGVAFRFYGPGATQWQGLWAGKSAQLITTMDTPPPVYRWLFHAPGTHAMRNATLGFCGVKPVRTLVVGPVRTSNDTRRKHWIERARRAGFALRRGVHSPVGRVWQRSQPWFKALRLQFYPMTWAAYTVGALAAAASTGLSWWAYLWGYMFLFCLEAATVFSNDYRDYPSDSTNVNHGPFNGGSRVLVTGEVSFTAMRLGIGLMLCAAFAAGGLAVHASPSPVATTLWLVLALVLTLGYTLPPPQLSYRGWGEVTVAFTHSAMVLWIGYLLQGGAAEDAVPWLLSMPLFLAILPAIILAGIPDRQADEEAGKRTLAVRFGNRNALLMAGAAVVLAAIVALVFERAGYADGSLHGVSLFVLPHAALCLCFLLYQLHRGPERMQRIDGTLVVTLHYMVWFVAVPFYRLL